MQKAKLDCFIQTAQGDFIQLLSGAKFDKQMRQVIARLRPYVFVLWFAVANDKQMIDLMDRILTGTN
jgi:hypothetical protein